MNRSMKALGLVALLSGISACEIPNPMEVRVMLPCEIWTFEDTTGVIDSIYTHVSDNVCPKYEANEQFYESQ